MAGIIFSIIAGASMSIQGVMNTRLGEKIGMYEANMYVQGTAFILSLIVMFLFGNGSIRGIADVNKLYLTIAESLNQAGVKEATVIRGDDYTYVSFANNVFFGANSSVLTREGQAVLYTFAKAIAPAAGGIEQVNIMSHTAKVTDNSQINPQIIRKDRILSAMRSAEVCIYLQQQNVIKPEKLVDISYGEYRPIADNSTEEGRIKNRRIEFLLLDNGAKERDLNEYYKEFKSGEYANTTVVTVGQSQSSSQGGETVPADTEAPVDTGAADAGAEDAGSVEEMQNTSE